MDLSKEVYNSLLDTCARIKMDIGVALEFSVELESPAGIKIDKSLEKDKKVVKEVLEFLKSQNVFSDMELLTIAILLNRIEFSVKASTIELATLIRIQENEKEYFDNLRELNSKIKDLQERINELECQTKP